MCTVIVIDRGKRLHHHSYEIDREGRVTWIYFTYVRCTQSNWYKLQIRRRIYVVMSSQIMEWSSFWLLLLNKAAESLSATAFRWFDARDHFEEFDHFFNDTFEAKTLFSNRISSLFICSVQQICWWRNRGNIVARAVQERKSFPASTSPKTALIWYGWTARGLDAGAGCRFWGRGTSFLFQSSLHWLIRMRWTQWSPKEWPFMCWWLWFSCMCPNIDLWQPRIFSWNYVRTDWFPSFKNVDPSPFEELCRRV